MILPLLTALLTAIGPLLWGWYRWTQPVLELAVIAGSSYWLASRILIGYLPLPSRNVIHWSSALAVLGTISVWGSPVRGLVIGEWSVFLCALWIFLAMPTLSKDQRSRVDTVIRISGWIVVALAFYQHYHEHEERPAAAFINQNIYAGTILLLLPLAVEKKDWLLALGLLCNLAWTRSVGAWLGLSLSLGLTQRRYSAFWFWVGAIIAAICGILIYAKLGTVDVLHRWWWWKAAAQMAWDRPWFGYGPGAFTYVLPKYVDRQQAGLLSLYAHEYPLQIFAEYGLLFGVLWFFGIWKCVANNVSHKSFGVMAILFQSLWDYPLSIPPNLWLMSYFAASALSDSSEGINIPSRNKLPALLLVVGLGACLSSKVNALWQGQRAALRAALEARTWDEARDWLETAKILTPENPEVFFASAQLSSQRGDWLQAAADLEESVRLDPYRAATWTQWQLAYKKMGRPEEAQRIFQQSMQYTMSR